MQLRSCAVELRSNAYLDMWRQARRFRLTSPISALLGSTGKPDPPSLERGTPGGTEESNGGTIWQASGRSSLLVLLILYTSPPLPSQLV